MARFQIRERLTRNDSEHHQVRRNARMATGPQVGDVLPHPTSPGESFTVTGRSKRYVTGETPTGGQVRETGAGIFTDERIGKRR